MEDILETRRLFVVCGIMKETMFLFYLVLFCFGLGFGSFFNVVSVRYKEDAFLFSRNVIGGRSHCPHCHKTLAWYELVPLLSYIGQGGRCRKCHAKLSLQYPLVEFFGGILFLVAPFYFLDKYSMIHIGLLGSSELVIAIALWEAVIMLLYLLSIIDYRNYLIPDEITYGLFGLGVLWVVFLAFISNPPSFGSFLGSYAEIFGLQRSIAVNHLFALIIGGLTIGSIFVLSRGRAIGFGDVKLVGALGLLFGWPDVLIIAGLSFVLGAIVSIPLLLRGEKGMKDFIPFAPFIALAAFLVFFFGADMMRVYLSAFLIG